LYATTDPLKRYQSCTDAIVAVLPFLQHAVSEPRSLRSTCRLVISHRLTVRGDRERDVRQLRNVPELVKNYLLFSDLTDPDYESRVLGTDPSPPFTPHSPND
jgi:hypothetical protein